MDKKRVAVLCGGYTAEKNISMGSGAVVFENIDRGIYDVYLVIAEKDGFFVQPDNISVDLSDFSFQNGTEKVKFDLVFNAIHGSPGEDGRIQGYLDILNIPYTNCGVACSALTFNKSWTKSVLAGAILQAKGYLVRNSGVSINDALGSIPRTFQLPLFVKPNNNGSSYGVSKIKDFVQLESAIREALQFDSEVLVEEGIVGKEVTCGVYRYRDEIIVMPICEIATDKHEFFDYTAKYTAGESDEIIPARISDTEKAAVEHFSSSVYQLLNCRGVVRMDYILRDGKAFFLEVNTVPGLSEASIVPKMAKASGLSLKEFFNRLLEEAKAG